MSNQEALDILDHNWTRLVNSDYTDIELGQAQDIAINAVRLVTVINTLFKDDVAKHIDKTTYNLLYEYFMN